MRNFSAIFAGFAALFVYLAIFPYQIGFEFHFWQQSKVLGVAYFVIFFPIFLQKRQIKQPAWWQLPAIESVFCLLGLGALGYLCRWWEWLSELSWGIALLGLLLFVWAIVDFWKKTNWKQKSVFLGLSFLLGTYFLAQIYAHYSHAPIYEAMIAFYDPTAHSVLLDMVYHSSITQMLQTYNVMTTGLDGLVTMNYNIFVHFLFAQLCLLLSISSLDFFNLAYPVLIFSLFFYTFLSLSDSLYQQIATYLQKPSNYVLFHFGSIIVLICLFFPLPDNIYSRGLLGMHFSKVAIYTTSLAFLFAFAETCLNYMAKPKHKYIFEWVFMPIFLFVLGYSHVSVGVAILAGIGYAWLLSRKWKNILGWLWILLHLSILFFCYWLTSETKPTGEMHSYEGRLNWFFFFRQEGFNVLEFVWGMYLPLALTIALIFWLLKTKFSFVSENKFLHYAAVLCLIALAGVSPNVILELYGSTGMYFMSVHRFLAGSLLMALVAFLHFSIPHTRIVQFLAGLGVLLWAYMSYRNTTNDAWKANIEVRKTITGISDFNWKANHFVEKLFSDDADWAKVGVLFDKNLEQKAMQNPFYAFARKLKDLGKNVAVAEKTQSLLYIPYHALNFKHFKERIPCMQVPIYFTATSGIALFEGLPNAKCTKAIGDYGYSYYNYEGREKTWQGGYDISEAFNATQQRGYRFLWYYDVNTQSFRRRN
ncbi:MAG: hypothetical protein Fur0027_18170 [Raineya sp.]